MRLKKSLPLVNTVGVLFFTGCSTVNTRIGLPMFYWHCGSWTFFGYAAVCMLVGIAVLVMIRASRHDTTDGPFSPVIAMLVGAAVILQLLPSVERGVQFIPLSPWSYSGLVPVCLSLLCWLGIVVAIIIVLASSGIIGALKGFSSVVLFSMGINLILSFASTDAGGKKRPLAAVSAADCEFGSARQPGTRPASCSDQVVRWKEKRHYAEQVLQRLMADREAIRARLGVTPTGDPKESKARPALVEESQELDSQIERLSRDIRTMGAVIDRVESWLRRLQRHELLGTDAPMTDEEWAEMSQTEHELQEELRAIRLYGKNGVEDQLGSEPLMASP